MLKLEAELKNDYCFTWDSSCLCVFSLRSNGSMSFPGNDKQQVIQARRQFLQRCGIELEELVCANQIHGCQIVRIDTPDKGKGAFDKATAIDSTDALITNQRRIAIGVLTADCLPITLYDPDTKSIGIIHAGWRSTLQRITSLTIERMQQEFKSNPKNLRVFLGPALRCCCYQVKEEFLEIFPEQTSIKNGKLWFDLVAANVSQLVSLGVENEHIVDCRLCTSCRKDLFFSYRKEGSTSSRFMSVVMLL
ncbi:MAG: peptidoglycan editing factor PgeF [Candidatus Omnitrophica bacterium]|nr:peptidoglycan editing factor PgeF [Candidatus Omnitrophota bacterium]